MNQMYLIKKVSLFIIYSSIIVLSLISCSKQNFVSELDGWSKHNSSIINNNDSNYMTHALFFQIEDPLPDDRAIENRIVGYLKQSAWESKIESYLNTKPNNWRQSCLFYRKKYFSAYSYNVYQSEDFERFGGFYGEKENLLGHVDYILIDGELHKNIYIFEE